MTRNLGDELPDLGAPEADLPSVPDSPQALPGAVLRIPVSIQVIIGSARLPLSRLASLAPGTLLTLEETLGTPARMLVNGREVARGELFVVDEREGRLGITITQVAGTATDS